MRRGRKFRHRRSRCGCRPSASSSGVPGAPVRQACWCRLIDTADVTRLDADLDQVVQPGRARVTDGWYPRPRTARLYRFASAPARSRARAAIGAAREELQVVRVEHHAAGVGVFPVHAQRGRKEGRRFGPSPDYRCCTALVHRAPQRVAGLGLGQREAGGRRRVRRGTAPRNRSCGSLVQKMKASSFARRRGRARDRGCPASRPSALLLGLRVLRVVVGAHAVDQQGALGRALDHVEAGRPTAPAPPAAARNR